MSARLSPPAPSGRSRRRLQWTLAALAAIPLASASREIVLGPQAGRIALTIDPNRRYHGTGAPIGGPRRPYGPRKTKPAEP